jgi:RimJ/RimL family protein N-acetyltransferase
MEIVPIELIGKRVKLIPLEIEHTHDLFEAGKYPEIWTYIARRGTTLNEIQNLVQGAIVAREKGQELPFVIVDQCTNRIVGSTRFLNISKPNKSLQIGSTWLTPEVWRTRINTECKYLLLHHCFETLSTLRVEIVTDSRNIRSQKAIERLGAVKEGVLRKHRIMPDGFVRDSIFYSIIAQEWEKVKVRLEGYLSNDVDNQSLI